MLKYYIYIIYEDGSTTYEGIIRSQEDIDKIPKSKAYYEAIKICYYNDDPKYCHVIYGKDNVFLRYYNDDDKCLYYSQFDDNEEFTKIIVLKGIGKEETFTDSTDLLLKTFKGKLLPDDDEYERLRIKCQNWRPPSPPPPNPLSSSSSSSNITKK